MNTNTRVILIRHGQSTYNAQGIYQGSCDDSILTEKGRVDAIRTGLALQDIDIDIVYCSPLQRAQETAKNILTKIDRRNNLPLQTHPNLQEIYLPTWQRLPYKYVRSHYVEDYQKWCDFPHEFNLELTEDKGNTLVKTKFYPIQDLYDKTRQFWTEILPSNKGKTILIVSHGGTIRALLSTALGIEARYYHYFQQSNCGISILDFPEPELNAAKLEALNLIQHLGEILPKLKAGKEGLRLLLLPIDPNYNQSKNSQLARIIQSISIDFCLNSIDSHSQTFIQTILSQQFANLFQLQTSQKDLLPIWQQTILANKNQNSGLVTGLVVIDQAILEENLTHIFNLPSCNYNLQLQPNTLSVIYYSNLCNHPIFQTINL
jgi:probable phosphoglycerate mutase